MDIPRPFACWARQCSKGVMWFFAICRDSGNLIIYFLQHFFRKGEWFLHLFLQKCGVAVAHHPISVILRLLCQRLPDDRWKSPRALAQLIPFQSGHSCLWYSPLGLEATIVLP